VGKVSSYPDAFFVSGKTLRHYKPGNFNSLNERIPRSTHWYAGCTSGGQNCPLGGELETNPKEVSTMKRLMVVLLAVAFLFAGTAFAAEKTKGAAKPAAPAKAAPVDATTAH
jgi:hypothetical protein